MRSAAEPRVCRYPSYRYSHVEDVVEQAELAGLVLDPWQRFVLGPAVGERDDGKWSAFEVGLVVGRQQGKGAILEARSLAGLFLFDEELILWSAHEYRTALEMFRRVRACIRRLGRRINDNLYDYDGISIKVNNTNGEEGFERLDTGQRIQFIARSKNAGRGFTADCLIWDEAYALVEDQVDAQMPTLLARPNSQIWYTSSPPLDAVSGAKLFSVRKRAQAGDAASLAYFEWGADGCLDNLSGIDLDDRELWASTLPAYGGRVTEEGVQRLRDAMSGPGFAREVLCIWPPDLTHGFAVIPEGDWAAALDEKSGITGPLALAVDVSPDRSRATIGAAGARPDGLLHAEVTANQFGIDSRPGTGWVVGRLREIVAAQKPCAVVIDRGGPAGSLIPAVEEARITVTQISMSDVARAFGMFYDAVSGKDEAARVLRHIGQPELTAAVAGAMKRALGSGSAWDRKNVGVDITPLVAVTNALYGYVTRPREPDRPFNAGVVAL